MLMKEGNYKYVHRRLVNAMTLKMTKPLLVQQGTLKTCTGLTEDLHQSVHVV